MCITRAPSSPSLIVLAFVIVALGLGSIVAILKVSLGS